MIDFILSGINFYFKVGFVLFLIMAVKDVVESKRPFFKERPIVVFLGTLLVIAAWPIAIWNYPNLEERGDYKEQIKLGEKHDNDSN